MDGGKSHVITFNLFKYVNNEHVEAYVLTTGLFPPNVTALASSVRE